MISLVNLKKGELIDTDIEWLSQWLGIWEIGRCLLVIREKYIDIIRCYYILTIIPQIRKTENTNCCQTDKEIGWVANLYNTQHFGKVFNSVYYN